MEQNNNRFALSFNGLQKLAKFLYAFTNSDKFLPATCNDKINSGNKKVVINGTKNKAMPEYLESTSTKKQRTINNEVIISNITINERGAKK